LLDIHYELLFNVKIIDPFASQNVPVLPKSEDQSLSPRLLEVEVANGQISKQVLEALLTVQTQLYSMAKDRDFENKYFQLGQRSFQYFFRSANYMLN
jgi:hypothetical protein